MVNFRLLNGKPRATLIQRFDGTVLVLGPKGKKIEFKDGVTIHKIHAEISKLGWLIGVEHLHISSSPYLNSQLNLYSLIKLNLSKITTRNSGSESPPKNSPTRSGLARECSLCLERNVNSIKMRNASRRGR